MPADNTGYYCKIICDSIGPILMVGFSTERRSQERKYFRHEG